MLDDVIEITGVTKRYGEVAALRDVSLVVRRGVTGLLGPNGSGKSTLIKSLLGLLQTQQGSGQILGYQWPAQVRAIRDSVGYLPEDDCYIAGLSGIESIAFMAHLSGLPGTEGLRRAHEIADFCDLGEERYREVESYSTGMRQKLKFAQALVHDPPLLILDEPTTGLDPKQRESMLERIRSLADRYGKSVILSTHILRDVRQVCDHVVMLVQGSVRIVDTLENLSRPAEPMLHVAVQGNSDAFQRRLSESRYSLVVEDDGSLRIGGIETREVDIIWRWAAETGASVRRLQPAQNSLDKIFFEAASVTAAATERTNASS